jgi:hypothetical protein
MVYTYIMYVTFCLYHEGIKGMKRSNMSSFPHESSLKYQPPTQSQLEAAELWVASFSNNWRSLDPDSLREGMQPDTRNLIPPMSSPANQDGVVAHFREVLKAISGRKVDCLGPTTCCRLFAARDISFSPQLQHSQLPPCHFYPAFHGWGYACYRELLYDGAGVAVEVIAI